MKKSKTCLLKCPFLACIFFSATAIKAQYNPNPLIDRVKMNNLANQVNNNPMYMDESLRISSGTPYFRNVWMMADIFAVGGKTFESIPVKLNLMMGQLLFLDKDGAEKEMVNKLLRVEMSDSSTGEKFIFIPVEGLEKTKDASMMVWCEVIEEGTATLLKKTNKVLSQNKTFPLDPKEKVIEESFVYYLRLDGQLYPLKRSKDLVPLLAKSLPSISSFNPTGQKKEEQWASMVQFYNQQLNNH
jgi:hypothetical protein